MQPLEGMMFLIYLTYKKPLTVVDQFLTAHREFLEQGYERDYFIVSGPREPRVGGIILSQLKDKEKLQQIIQQDPFYINGIADYEIIPFIPVKYHRNFATFV